MEYDLIGSNEKARSTNTVHVEYRNWTVMIIENSGEYIVDRWITQQHALISSEQSIETSLDFSIGSVVRCIIAIFVWEFHLFFVDENPSNSSLGFQCACAYAGEVLTK